MLLVFGRGIISVCPIITQDRGSMTVSKLEPRRGMQRHQSEVTASNVKPRLELLALNFVFLSPPRAESCTHREAVA